VPRAPRKNPYAAFNFLLEVIRPPSGLTVPSQPPRGEGVFGFMEVSGLDSETAILEYRDGNFQATATGNFAHKQPGLERYPNVVMRRGLTAHIGLWAWRKLVMENGDREQINGDIHITLQAENHSPVFRWTLKNCWPCKLSGPALNAKSNEIAIESVEFCVERIVVEETF
jgi:phage tail-like protein